MFYDVNGGTGSQWLVWVESAFEAYGLEPANFKFFEEGKNTAGSYEINRDKVAQHLESGRANIQIFSSFNQADQEQFPSSMSISISVRGGKIQGSVSVKVEGCKIDYQCGLDVAKELHSFAGAFYGHLSAFPSILGPDYYLSGVSFIPSGWSFGCMSKYSRRLASWRQNYKRLGEVYGYFREIFPINILNASHFAADICGKGPCEYYAQYGDVFELVSGGEQFVWVVNEDAITTVRLELERAGLIASSENSL